MSCSKLVSARKSTVLTRPPLVRLPWSNIWECSRSLPEWCTLRCHSLWLSSYFLSTNIRLFCKNLPEANTVAYLPHPGKTCQTRTLQLICRILQKNLPGANTLAYFAATKVTNKKKFFKIDTRLWTIVS
jgi:hypothetical protein